MTFLIRPPHRIKKKQTKEAQGILDNLAKYLDESSEEPAEMLCGFWKDQQDAITYQELRVAVQDGALSEGTFKQWSNDYSVLVQKQLTPIWNNAIEVGSRSQPIVSDLEFAFNTQTPGLMRWISERGAEFVTASTVDQRKAIASLLAKKVTDEHTVDELARLIRPCIGLTDGDSKATLRYYDNIVKTLKEQHPRMKPESVRKKALDVATKYAEKKHRARAFTIAQTEMAFAYNRGADEGVRQAQQNNLLGVCEKRWITSGDDQVCPTCAALDGTQIGMDDNFDFKGRLLFTGQKLVPPAHPRCGCGVQYIEVSQPVFEPEISADPYDGQELDRELYEQAEADIKANSFRGRDNTPKERIVEMVNSVRTYTEADYTNILAAQNNFGGRFTNYSSVLSKEEKAKAVEDAKNIQEFIRKSPKYQGEVYRGLGFDVGGPADMGQYEEFRKLYKAGEVIETDTFTSWTKNKDVLNQIHSARTFLDDECEYSVEVTLRMRQSVGGVDISQYAELKGQEEVLFNKETAIHVKKVTENWKNDELLEVIIDVEEM